MNKQEVIEEVKTLKPDEQNLHEYQPEEWEAFKDGFDDAKCYAELAVEKLDEPEKPMLSKAEADWIEKLREVKHNTDEMIVTIARYHTDCDFVFKSHGESYKLPFKHYKGKESFGSVRHRLLYAVIYGYETKPLYTVEIPNPNGDGYSKTFLGKFKDDKVELCKWSGYTSIEFTDNWKQEEYAQLTEAEIKKDFDWAWDLGFAEEVEK